MTSECLQETFSRFDRRYFSGSLCDWAVTTAGNWSGLYGEASHEKQLVFVRPAAHKNDHDIEATLIHEMAHAVLPLGIGHGERWVAEMNRLRAAGAPTDPLDFIPDYAKNRSLVTDFIYAAQSGATWQEAATDLFPPDTDRELYSVCKHLFDLERAKRGSDSAI
jgi:hypothetical protein